ncbi:MAG TPA: ATP-binding protein, partial [Mycobacteriales bacterium]|nr:ATP-binding protein [Mycobacteriales bacterium]
FREAEQRFRALAEAAPIGIYELGPDGAPVYVNDQALTIAGLNRRRFAAGASLESHVGVARRQRFRRPLAIGSDETPESFEFHHPDGSTRHALRLSRPLSDPSGDVRGYVCLLIDVTEDIRVRRQLSDLERRRTEVIEQLVRAGEEERARIATELHDDTVQVLAAALIMIDRMAKQTSGELLDRVAELRQMVSTASERARRMTFELRPQVLEASGLGDAVELLAEQLRHDHPGLSVEVDASIPRQSETIEQIAYRAVQEAVRNVRRHSHARNVRIRVWSERGTLWGEVTDDGHGFDKTATRVDAHLHLGLDGTRERLRLAGGSLELHSEPGAGTTFRFHIPAAGRPTA